MSYDFSAFDKKLNGMKSMGKKKVKLDPLDDRVMVFAAPDEKYNSCVSLKKGGPCE